MLTVDTLRQNTILAALTNEQLAAIAEMSRNDENAVIGARIGALHGQYDEDIFNTTGVKKNAGEKSYEYAKRVLADYKSNLALIDATKSDLNNANAQIAKLQAEVEKGASDKALTQQLKDAKALVAQLQSKLSTKEAELKTAKDKFDADIKNIHVNHAFHEAASNIKFKDGITEPIQKTLLNAAKTEILAKYVPDFMPNEDGSTKLVLRDTNGNVVNNPNNNLNPYTLRELILETSLKDVIDTGRRQQGGGTGPNIENTGGSSSVINISQAKTQVEAYKMIESHLLASGLTRDSQEFFDKVTELGTENNVSSLPIR